MKKSQLIQVLDKYLPEGCAPPVVDLLVENPVHFKIVKPRKTKLGDFRYFNGKMMITVNGDLNQYEFLVTTLHEIAHLQTHVKFGRKVAPHGREWKMSFILLKKRLLDIHNNTSSSFFHILFSNYLL